MSVDVSVTTTIDRPRGVVAAYAGDPSNAPTWYRRIERAEWKTEPPIALGSQIEFQARFLGKDMVYTYEVVELSADLLVMRTAEGPFPMQTEYTWTSDGETTTSMTLRNHGMPSGFSKVFAPLMSVAMKKAMTEDLAKLKTLLEAGPSS